MADKSSHNEDDQPKLESEESSISLETDASYNIPNDRSFSEEEMTTEGLPFQGSLPEENDEEEIPKVENPLSGWFLDDDEDEAPFVPDDEQDSTQFPSLFSTPVARIARFNNAPPAVSVSALHQFFPKLTTIDLDRNLLVLVGPQHLKDYAYKRRDGTAKEASGSFIDYVRWLKRLDKDAPIIPHISGNDSAETIIAHSDLSHGNFHGCIIEGIHFKQVNFSYTNFRDAVLYAVTFTDCDCKQMDLRGADIHDLVMDAESDSKANHLIIDITDIKKATAIGAVPSNLTFRNAIIDPNYASFRQDSEIDIDIILIPCTPQDVKIYLKQRAEGILDHDIPFNQFIKEHKNIHEEDSVVVMADLSNMNFPKHGITDLSHTNFAESVLSGAILAGCTLDYANFKHANLESCNLTNASAYQTCFDDVSGRFMNARSAKMHEASFKYANLSYSDFSACQMDKARGDYANFSHSIWNPKEFTAAPEQYASLANANMPFSNFKYARATYINMEGAQMKSAHFDGAIFAFTNGRKANFSNATMRHFITTNSLYAQANFRNILADYAQFRQDQTYAEENIQHLEKANFSHAHLEMALFLRQNAPHINLSSSNADQMQVIDCFFPMADMHNASMRGARFSQTARTRTHKKTEWLRALLAYFLRRSDHFSLDPSSFNPERECHKINAVGANMDRAAFSYGSFKQSHFEFASLVDCKFIHCDFSQSNFAHTHVKGSFWQHVLLRYTNFTYASLESTAFNHCDFSFTKANASNFSMARFYRSLLHKVNFDNCSFFKACFRMNFIEYIEGTLLYFERVVFSQNIIRDPTFFAAQQEFITRYSLYGKWLLMCYSLAVGGGNILGTIVGSGATIASVSSQITHNFAYLHHAFVVSDLFVPIVITIPSIICGYYTYRMHPEVTASIRLFFCGPTTRHSLQKYPFKTPPLNHHTESAQPFHSAKTDHLPLTEDKAQKILSDKKLFGDDSLTA